MQKRLSLFRSQSLGGLYEKQRNIWGVAIIHYVMGEAGTCLGFII